MIEKKHDYREDIERLLYQVLEILKAKYPGRVVDQSLLREINIELLAQGINNLLPSNPAFSGVECTAKGQINIVWREKPKKKAKLNVVSVANDQAVAVH